MLIRGREQVRIVADSEGYDICLMAAEHEPGFAVAGAPDPNVIVIADREGQEWLLLPAAGCEVGTPSIKCEAGRRVPS